MRLIELVEAEKKLPGTYSGVHFDNATKDAIVAYCKENKIPNAPKGDKLHTTVLYSKKPCPNYKPQGKINPPYIGVPSGFDVWDSQPDKDGKKSRVLVLKFNSPKLVARHKALMKEHEATYDFDEYIPHVTFSYDIGDMDAKKLPKFDHNIKMVEEYYQPLDLDWATNNTNKE